MKNNTERKNQTSSSESHKKKKKPGMFSTKITTISMTQKNESTTNSKKDCTISKSNLSYKELKECGEEFEINVRHLMRITLGFQDIELPNKQRNFQYSQLKMIRLQKINYKNIIIEKSDNEIKYTFYLYEENNEEQVSIVLEKNEVMGSVSHKEDTYILTKGNEMKLEKVKEIKEFPFIEKVLIDEDNINFSIEKNEDDEYVLSDDIINSKISLDNNIAYKNILLRIKSIKGDIDGFFKPSKEWCLNEYIDGGCDVKNYKNPPYSPLTPVYISCKRTLRISDALNQTKKELIYLRLLGYDGDNMIKIYCYLNINQEIRERSEIFIKFPKKCFFFMDMEDKLNTADPCFFNYMLRDIRNDLKKDINDVKEDVKKEINALSKSFRNCSVFLILTYILVSNLFKHYN